MPPGLKLFTGQGSSSRPTVSVRLGEITDALCDAAKWNRTWLDDFQDEPVEISADLYEVICQYQLLRKSA